MIRIWLKGYNYGEDCRSALFGTKNFIGTFGSSGKNRTGKYVATVHHGSCSNSSPHARCCCSSYNRKEEEEASIALQLVVKDVVLDIACHYIGLVTHYQFEIRAETSIWEHEPRASSREATTTSSLSFNYSTRKTNLLRGHYTDDTLLALYMS